MKHLYFITSKAGTLAVVWGSPKPSPMISATLRSHRDSLGADDGPPPVALADRLFAAIFRLAWYFLSVQTYKK